ncbi:MULTISPECIES: helix-turn-helix domain-containing protein [Streptomycetaceae]|uniref:Helix-turn-helix domain-containing protein n=1 Tax=Streptantibioticus cattleyicolor (strain ATCC 35852 / DSM 46488 / JCM 4925 / NBRC 14057 / NRRL 8057) TaxID=1003195 RepID=F8K088_STREN|nr:MULTISPECIES: helix-turn-helix domain-containing protein [Streptomycetaceae]AEW96072.1 hypothetical protein SCATT_37010 [Streptantibioticus cattleyicolor NRRL 8057 = DSM 46488]MYS60602.1 hypothetical protein [Streptomyces sp. SID5468]CCB76408.1 protein of unknown function [Streptantibioticus cattleyicolor NRRL 8057 = DSM 46488]
MARWQPLPEELAPELRRLTLHLRRLTDRTGLSLAALGATTAYDPAQWDRYLNAADLVPRQAVHALVALAGADPDRVSALWEAAAWQALTGARPRTADQPRTVRRARSAAPAVVTATARRVPAPRTPADGAPRTAGRPGKAPSAASRAPGGPPAACGRGGGVVFGHREAWWVRAGGGTAGGADLTTALRAERRARHRRALLAALVAIAVLGLGLASGLALLRGGAAKTPPVRCRPAARCDGTAAPSPTSTAVSRRSPGRR